jgi:RES domain-containing protein
MSKAIQAWRLVKRNWVDTAFDGEGAFRFGGRWNNRGQRMVYASSTLALAFLEILVHIDPTGCVPELAAIPIEIPLAQIEAGGHSSVKTFNKGLPWSLSETRRVGDAWIAAARKPALRVASAIIPVEKNYLLNPGHPEFARCRIGSAQKLPLDPRLLSR